MIEVLRPLGALYAVLAVSSFAVTASLGQPWYGIGVLWIAVTGFSQFFFALSADRRRPKAFVWIVLGGGFVRMLLAAATVILPLSIAQPEGFRSDSLQFALLFMIAQGVEAWIAVRRAS
jgi:hypothetical protein